MSQDGYTLDNARDERELMDEIWFEAMAEQYRLRVMHGAPPSRLEIIKWYLDRTPEMQRLVDKNIAAGTCAYAARELRADRERRKPKPPRAAPLRKGRTFIAEMNAPAPTVSSETGKRKRGPKADTMARVIMKMRDAIRNGYDLKAAKGEEMASMFEASRTLCTEARKKVLSELRES